MTDFNIYLNSEIHKSYLGVDYLIYGSRDSVGLFTFKRVLTEEEMDKIKIKHPKLPKLNLVIKDSYSVYAPDWQKWLQPHSNIYCKNSLRKHRHQHKALCGDGDGEQYFCNKCIDRKNAILVKNDVHSMIDIVLGTST